MKIKFVPGLFVLLFASGILLSGTLFHNSNSREQITPVSQITVTNSISGSLDIGIGWNDATVLKGRWPNRQFNQDDWNRYFDLMAWSGCHWLRHAVSITDWEPENDNDDPDSTNWNGFSFNSEQMQHQFIFLDQAEKHNIKVLLTNWRLGAKWLSSGNDYLLAPPDNNEEFAESMAALIYYLKKVKKYKCVWALSLWNEPNGNWAYKGPGANYPDSFWPLYSAVDRQLRRLGVRNEILLLGPDTSTGGKPGHIPEMLAKYGPVVDIVCDHDYSAFLGERMDRSIKAYSLLVDNLKDVRGRKLPFVIGEFGNYGNGSQAVDNDDSVYFGALSTAAYLIRMLNHGVAGLARWEFHIYGNTWRNFGALTRTDPDFIFKPYGPVYYPHAIAARYLKPGWKVRKLQLEGNQEGFYASALTSPKNDITVLLLNVNREPQAILLKLNLPVHKTILHDLLVTGPVPDGITRLKDLQIDSSGISIILPARSITTLTSLDPGDLDLPIRLSPKRPGNPVH